MTGMLASVNSLEEALLALSANVDIIDLKQPALGALGALETDLVKAIVNEINGRCPVSATIGDLPMQPEIVYQAVKAMAETGVDYVKIGFFPGGDWQGTIEKLATFPRIDNLNRRIIRRYPIGFRCDGLTSKCRFQRRHARYHEQKQRPLNPGHGKNRHSPICPTGRRPVFTLRAGRFAQTG